MNSVHIVVYVKIIKRFIITEKVVVVVLFIIKLIQLIYVVYVKSVKHFILAEKAVVLVAVVHIVEGEVNKFI